MKKTILLCLINLICITVSYSLPCKKISGAWDNVVLGNRHVLTCQRQGNPLIATYHITPQTMILQARPATLTDDELALIRLIDKNTLAIGDTILSRSSDIPFSKPRSPGSAKENCDTLTNYFKQHYAFFQLRGIHFHHWQKTCEKTMGLDPLSQPFFNVLVTMLAQLHDNHVMLTKSLDQETPDYTGFALREPFSSLLTAEVNRYNQEHHQSLSNSDYIDKVLTPTTKKYLLQQVHRLAGDDHSFWGPLKTHSNIMYFYIHSMEEDLTPHLEKMVDYLERHHIKGLIIDVRFNQGGDDAIGRHIMSYFINQPRIAYWKSTFYDAGRWAPPKAFEVKPATKSISLPIVVLTSPITASAAESFALAMLPLPNVTLIGDRSMGIFSDQFPRRLPNGWWITLSNEKMLSSDKKIAYEKIGLPVAISASFPLLTDLERKGDAGLKAAVDFFARQT